jgi:hypothetical protein
VFFARSDHLDHRLDTFRRLQSGNCAQDGEFLRYFDREIEEISIDFEARINSVELIDIKNKFDTKDKKTKNSSDNPDDPLEDVNEISNKNVNTEILIEMKKHNFVSPATPVKVSIKFKDSDPPEGIVRVSEHILNQIK